MGAVSVYVPVYNGRKYLERCLTAVINQTYPIAEIVIVDDGSTDGIDDIAQRPDISSRIRLVRLSRRSGIAAARNAGVAHTSSAFIASVDCDCVPDARWLERLMAQVADPSVGGVGGHLAEAASEHAPDRWRQRHMAQSSGCAGRDVAFLSGSNTVMRRAMIVGLLGYNERFMLNHEDTDLGRRAVAAGWRLRFEPDAIVTHIKQDSRYSVLRSCWGFRYARPAGSLCAVIVRSTVEMLRTVRLVCADLACGDGASAWNVSLWYGVYHAYFLWRSYQCKHCNFP